MRQFIKNARVFSAVLPAANLLAEHLQELLFTPMSSSSIVAFGFEANDTTKELVTQLQGGFSFTFRFDQKIIPGDIVKQRLQVFKENFFENMGRRPTKTEVAQLRDNVIVSMASTAPIRTKLIHVFYSQTEQLLFIPVISKSMSSRIMGQLIRACGSVKTTTIHVDGLTNGLASRLVEYLNREDDTESMAFDGEFEPSSYVVLGCGKNKVTYDLNDLGSGSVGIIERVDAGFNVNSLQLERGPVSFRIDSEFVFKAISLPEYSDDEAADDMAYQWRQQAQTEIILIADAVKALCVMFDYKAPEESDEEATEE